MLVPSGRLVVTLDCEDSAGDPLAPTGTPTAVLYKIALDGTTTDTGVTPTVATLGTTTVVASAVVPSNAAQGEAFFLRVTATVDGTSKVRSSKPETVFGAAVPANVTQFGGANGTFSGGRPEVTVTTNNDKTGYSLSQSFPTNFASLAITGGGAVTAGTVSDKTGYSLTTAPLDAAGVRAAVGLASANLDTQLGTLATTAGIAALTGSQFTAIPWNSAWDAEVQSECTDAIVAAGLPRSGVTLRYTQVAANSGSKTADVSIGAAS